jgi:hypothetical protein
LAKAVGATTDERTTAERQWITQILTLPGTAVTTEVAVGTEITIEEVAETAGVRAAGVRTGEAVTETSIESESEIDEALLPARLDGNDGVDPRLARSRNPGSMKQHSEALWAVRIHPSIHGNAPSSGLGLLLSRLRIHEIGQFRMIFDLTAVIIDLLQTHSFCLLLIGAPGMMGPPNPC